MADQPFKFYSASDDIKIFGSFDESEEKFTVVNKTTGNLEIFWINYSGQEIKYSTLQPDQLRSLSWTNMEVSLIMVL